MIYVRDGEIRVVNDAKGQEGYRTYEPDGRVREPLHRLSPFARGVMFPASRRLRPRPPDFERRWDAWTGKSIRKVVGRAAWHRWNVLKKRIPTPPAREQARYFIHRARFRRVLRAAAPEGGK